MPEFETPVVFHGYLDRIDQIGPRIIRLDRFRCKLALLRYPRDGSRIFKLLVTAEIGNDCDTLPYFQSGKLRSREIGAQIYVAEIGNPAYLPPRSRELARLGIFDENRSCERGFYGAFLNLFLKLLFLVLHGHGIVRNGCASVGQ